MYVFGALIQSPVSPCHHSVVLLVFLSTVLYDWLHITSKSFLTLKALVPKNHVQTGAFTGSEKSFLSKIRKQKLLKLQEMSQSYGRLIRIQMLMLWIRPGATRCSPAIVHFATGLSDYTISISNCNKIYVCKNKPWIFLTNMICRLALKKTRPFYPMKHCSSYRWRKRI